jgi:hypothetical protein
MAAAGRAKGSTLKQFEKVIFDTPLCNGWGKWYGAGIVVWHHGSRFRITMGRG